MNAVEKHLFEGGVRQKIKRQFVLIRREKIDTEAILNKLTQHLEEAQYNITSRGKSEIGLRIDKKKNIPETLVDIHRRIVQLINDKSLDENLLFRVLTSGNEIVVRIKRKNG